MPAGGQPFGVEALRSTMASYARVLVEHAEALNRMNVYPVPDGDTGTNMARTLEAVLIELEGVPVELAATCRAISHGSLMGARGNSGVILSQILRALSGVAERAGGITSASLSEGLHEAASAAYRAVLHPVEGTMLTVAREAAIAAEPVAAAGEPLLEVLAAAHRAGYAALARSPELLPVLRDAGVVDAGAAGFLLLFDAALHVLDARPLPPPAEVPTAAVSPHGRGGDTEPAGDVGDLHYEVMFFLSLPDERIDGFRSAWGELGGSIVVVGGEGVWNCHIHTDEVGPAIEAALLAGGTPSGIRVTDLREPTAVGPDPAFHARADPARVEPPPAPDSPAGACAVVAVCTGDGVEALLRQLGVQAVVAGGQTMNPSTAELLAAVQSLDADQVVLLPNNKNIVPVARQLVELCAERGEKDLAVVPTTSLPEAIAALVAFDPSVSARDNAEMMSKAMAGVVTGEVAQAVRGSSSPLGSIEPGTWMGLRRGEGVVSLGTSALEAAVGLLDVLVDPRAELVTVLVGEIAHDADVTAVSTWLAEHRPWVELEVHRGGQPLYPFVFGVE